MSISQLEYCKTHDGYWLGKRRSKETIAKWRAGYIRHCKIHGNPMQGKRHTEEVKQSLREQALAWHKTHENPFRGRRHSENTKEQMSINSGQAKSYPAFYNTKTDVYIPAGYNLRRTCQKHELIYGRMLNLKNGAVEQTRDGWRVDTCGTFIT